MAVSAGGWLAARTVARQERAYRGLIAAMKRGEPRLGLKVAAEAVAATGLANPKVLEVGCGSGHYSGVFATPLAGGVRYTGVDYSSAMIARAPRMRPQSPSKLPTRPGCPMPTARSTSSSTACR